MIRALVLALGLLIGLAAAVAMGGRMAHLRLVAGSQLPGWTQGIAADAGVLRGAGTVRGAALQWRLAGVDFGGPRWVVALGGSDWQGQATMRAGSGRLHFDAVRGLVPGAILSHDGQGALAVADGALAMSLGADAGLTGWLEGRANALALGASGTPVNGAARIEATRGAWRMTAP